MAIFDRSLLCVYSQRVIDSAQPTRTGLWLPENREFSVQNHLGQESRENSIFGPR